MSTTTLINKVLKRRGIKDLNELSNEERADYDRWKKVMTGDVVTIPMMKDFMKAQIHILETRFAVGDTNEKQDAFYKACLHVYLNLLQIISAPEAERASLERYLQSLIT
jgi:hypothetical protein